jgi:outer membrane lipoprotein-sorting protein
MYVAVDDYLRFLGQYFMKGIIRGGSLIAAMLVMFCVLGVGSARAQLNVLLKKMEDHYRGLSSLKASVRMDQFSSQLGEHDVRDGNLIYIPQKGRDAQFRIDWTKPAVESLAVVNKQYVIFRPALKIAYTGSVSSVSKQKGVNGAMAILNMSRADLKNNFDMIVVGEETVASGTRATHLLLTPKTPTSYKNADVWVDVDGMPIQMKQTENNGDNTTILISGVTKNAKVSTSEVQIKPPSGTKIVKS